MNREIEINNFLNHLAKIYSQNPKFQIDSDTIYYYLMSYDIDNNEIENSDIEDNFDKWIEHFKNKKNIDVYRSERQKRFLQFSHGYPNHRCIKLYLSFPKDKIYECVNKVFEYVASNKMATASKVADMMRSDSVVLRLDSIENAKKVIDFVNNDLELSNTCKKTNLFLIKSGNVGIAYDHMLSYNSVLSLLLELYFKYCRMNNRLNEVSLSTFKEYVDNLYNNLFSNKSNLAIFLNNPSISKNLSRFHRDEVGLICNYEEIMKLISESLNPNVNLDMYFAFYNQCLTEQKTRKRYSHYDNLIRGKENDLTSSKEIELLNEYIRYAEKKYGGYSVAPRLERYVQGNVHSITRDNGYRNKFTLNLSPNKILEITNNKIKEYVESHLERKLKKNSSAENYEAYLNACIATYNKYGANQLYTAIISSINGEYGYFTNDGNYRDILIRNNCTKEIDTYCKMIVQTYGNEIILSNNLYQNCANAIISFVKEKNQRLQSKII